MAANPMDTVKADIGVTGLAVMGSNLARNFARNGFVTAVHNRTKAKTDALIAEHGADGTFVPSASTAEFVAALARPRKIIIMVKAGDPTDAVINEIAPLLEDGDILIDGGNAKFSDTRRREAALRESGVHFVGCGISGGEEGALNGPSIMPGGSNDAWDALAPIFRAIAAKAEDGEPCVAHMGPRGAGHYVKMVHNGIEYGDMQLIAEVYDLLHRGAGMSAPDIADVFEDWNRRELRSYLIEITARVLRHVDADTGKPLVDVILDEAQQKGTGKWMSQNAFDIGAPIPTVNAAVEARILSALKAERVIASRVLTGPSPQYTGDRSTLIDSARQALYASKIMSYAQGLAMLRLASHEYKYDIDPGTVAMIWRAGCIIRADLLGDIRNAFRRDPALVNLLLDEKFRTAVIERQAAWRFVVQTAVGLGIPVSAMSTSLAYYDAYRSERLPANLTQAQRDFFGAHTYRRIDKDGSFHTEWMA